MAEQKQAEPKEAEQKGAGSASFQTQWSQPVGNGTEAVFGVFGKDGTPFNEFGGDGSNKRIDGIRLWTGVYVDAIQIRVNGEWQSKYGGGGGKEQELILAEGEYITSVDCRGDKIVDKLVFYTNYNNEIGGGGDGGNSFGKQPGADNAQLIDIKGKSGRRLDRIEFKWGPASNQLVPKWSRKYGGNGGSKWDLNAIGKTITGVRLFGGKYVDSIEFQVDHEWTAKHGGSGGGINIYISVCFNVFLQLIM